jgi:pilus assembly protein CpaC
MKPMLKRSLRCALQTGSALLLLAGTAAPALAASDNSAVATENGVLLMSVGASRVVNLPANMSDVIIANPDVVDVHVRSQRQLYLIAKGPGQTDITVTTEGGKPIYRATVRVGTNLTSVDQMLRLAMPEADITVSTLNGMTLLTGTVAAPEDAAEAERLVAAFVGDKDNAKGSVVSRLRTATPLTVNLQVRIAEVNKSIAKSIGFNLATADLTSGFKFGIGQGRGIINDKWTIGGPLATGNGMKPIVGADDKIIGTGLQSQTSGTTFAADTSLFGLNILAALDLAENQGLASTLASPNLTALSGETASFLAGGEIPIPLSTGIGQVSVEYKQYGVSLAFTPTVLADGRISMRVRPEVSQIDESVSVVLNNFSVPGVSTRRAETTVELGSGQSFMIGGLMSSTTGNSVSKAPFLGDLPIIGNLFKSSTFRRQESELVIIVTPYLVKPVNARDAHLPTDGLRNANDAQRYFGAMLNGGKSGAERPKPQMAPPVTVSPDAVPALDNAQPSASSRKSGKAAAAPGFSF